MGKHLTDVEYKVRMMQNLKDKIAESAKEHNRSMNADIVARLEESFSLTNYDDAYKKFLRKKINNLTYTVERLELQIGNISFLIKTTKDTEKLNKWHVIKEFMEVEKEMAIENLKRLFDEQPKSIELTTLDEETLELLHKYCDIKKVT